ncbi:MAG: cytochrome P460 family protein [Pyrinomonadaceae bacterium]
MFPGQTVQSGLGNIATTGGRTRIRFPAPGEITPEPPAKPKTDSARRTPAPEPSTSAPDVAHATIFGFAYANEIARIVISTDGRFKFPVGSIIVREKLLSPQAASAETLVVMIKRERDFNPKANDWEFLTISGDLKTIAGREKEGKCQQCHASEARNDYVFRYPIPGAP